jgi:hypothetical protein
MGETRVDLQHLLEDLRDAYPGSLEETILTEILANSLDSGATRITLATDSALGALTVVDNGSGMQRRDLARYHDVAASTKTRGEGIGFAGVGIKLGLLVCKEVVTETRRGKTHVASVWHLASRHRAPWKWVSPPGLVTERGTAVRMNLRNPLSPLLDPGFIEQTVHRHYQPLFDPLFDEMLRPTYSQGIVVDVNGHRLERQTRNTGAGLARMEVRFLRKRKPAALGYLLRGDQLLPEDQRGLAISTYGKVIRRGWDWLGVTPAEPGRIGGLIEAPGLAASLTLNKGDFIRSGARGAAYLAYRKAIQEAVSRQLAQWGDVPSPPEERPRQLRPLERDLERVIEDLSDDFPLLASLVEHRAGGQKRLPIGGRGSQDAGAISPAVIDVEPPPELEGSEGEPGKETDGGSLPPESPTPMDTPLDIPPPASPPLMDAALPDRGRSRVPARYGLSIQFEDRPDDPELGRLVESTIWVNQAHPAYRRAVASRSIGYHLSLSVALALAPLAVDPAAEHAFVTAFLSRWGQALDGKAARRRKK